jgi:hypothetical protein
MIMVAMARSLLERLRPRNLFDGLGLVLQIVGLAGWIDSIIHLPDYASANGWSWQVLNVACFTLVFCGFFIRRVAMKQPIFGQRRKPGR